MVLIGEARDFTPVARVLQDGPAGDFIGTYWGILYLISERFRQLLLDQGITGWSAEPLSITHGSRVMEAWLLSISGRCGPVFGAGGVQGESIPSIGHFLDSMQWDGSDMFVPDNLNAIYVTQECAELLRSGGLTNLEIELAGLEALST
jgi:hypothetical protein